MFLCFLSCMFLYIWKQRTKTPPGPKRIPLLGSLPFLPTDKGIFDWVLDKKVTKHKLARVDLGPNPVYLINDFGLAKDLFDKEEFSGRTPSNIQLLHRFFNGTPNGIIFTQEEQR